MNSKNRLFRILKMISLLNSRHKKWRVRELAEHFRVTPKTIYRDIQVMEELGIPIYDNPDDYTYSILDDFYFKAPDMTREEALALLLVGQAFQEEFFPYKEPLDTGVTKILNSLPSSIQKVVNDLGEQISYQYGPFVDLSDYRDIIQEVEKCVENSTSIIIEYYSLTSNRTTRRKIDPYQFEYYNGACYVIGYCHNRGEIRLFRVDRIKEIETTAESFAKDADFNRDQYMGSSWGVERSDEERKVVLKFSGKAAKLVREKEWHKSQRIYNLPGDKIRFEISTSSMQEIKYWILGFGAGVEVLEPGELKEEVIEEIEKMKKIYR